MRSILLTLVLMLVTLASSAQSFNFSEGKKFLNEGDNEKAVDYFTRDLNDDPNNPVTLLYRAYAYYNNNNYASALRDANSGLKYVSRKQKALKADLIQVKARVYVRIDDMDKALVEYAECIKLNPTDVTFFTERAQVYYDLKEYGKSDADYYTLLKLDETNSNGLAGLGRSFTAQERYDEADKMLNRYISLYSNFDVGYYFIAKSQLAQGKYDLAVTNSFEAIKMNLEDSDNIELFFDCAQKSTTTAYTVLNTAVLTDAANPLWLILRAGLLQFDKKYVLALNDFTKLISQVEPNKVVDILKLRADCFSDFGMIPETLGDLDVAISMYPEDVDLYYIRGHYRKSMRNIDGALSDFNKAIELAPTESRFYAERGNIAETVTKDYQSALKDYDLALSFDPDNTRPLMYRGRLYAHSLNDMQKAEVDLNRILELDTLAENNASIRYFALIELGKREEAIEWAELILEKDSAPETHYNVACMYSLLKDTLPAIEQLTKSFEKGYNDLYHIDVDSDLDYIRDLVSYRQLLEKYQQIIKAEQLNWKNQSNDSSILTKHVEVTVPMITKGVGVYEVACKINELPLNFIFDTGASDITISQTEVQFMLKNNYLKKSDIYGSQSFMDATGNVSEGTKIVLRKVEIGELVLNNVPATIVLNSNAPLLFGQSALGKYARIMIDNEKKTITISR